MLSYPFYMGIRNREKLGLEFKYVPICVLSLLLLIILLLLFFRQGLAKVGFKLKIFPAQPPEQLMFQVCAIVPDSSLLF